MKKMQRIGFAGKVVLVAVDKARKGFDLIGAQFVWGIQVLWDAIGDFFLRKPMLDAASEPS
ncbi:hypothetical protein JXO59_01910 [candidate division KSB1 bacterium]|nr:hypothetical protein [candidate division KSB1 bacterium]